MRWNILSIRQRVVVKNILNYNLNSIMWLFLFFVFCFVLLDQVSKYFFYNQMFLSDYSLFNPILNLWIARSLPLAKELVIWLSILVIGWCFFWIFFGKKNLSLFEKWFFVLLISGAFGNLIDRIVYEWVRDFIDLWFFPVFNIADILLSLSIVFLLTYELRKDWLCLFGWQWWKEP